MRALMWLPVTAAVCAGCSQGRAERQQTLEQAGRRAQAVAAGSVVRELRAPTDTDRVIYSPPTDLALPPTAAAATPAASSGSRTSVPDTGAARGERRPGSP